MTAVPLFEFKSRRSGSPGGHVAMGPQALVATRAAGAKQTRAPAVSFSFPAFVLCRRPVRGRAPIPMPGTMRRLRSEVRDAFVAMFRTPEAGQKAFAARIRDGAVIVKVQVTMDPAFNLPKGWL